MKIYWRVMLTGTWCFHFGTTFFRSVLGFNPHLSRCQKCGKTFIMSDGWGTRHKDYPSYINDYEKRGRAELKQTNRAQQKARSKQFGRDTADYLF